MLKEIELYFAGTYLASREEEREFSEGVVADGMGRMIHDRMRKNNLRGVLLYWEEETAPIAPNSDVQRFIVRVTLNPGKGHEQDRL